MTTIYRPYPMTFGTLLVTGMAPAYSYPQAFTLDGKGQALRWNPATERYEPAMQPAPSRQPTLDLAGNPLKP